MGTGITTSIRYYHTVSTVLRKPNTSTLCFTTASTNGWTASVTAVTAFWACTYTWTIPGAMAGNGFPGHSATICARTAYPGVWLRTAKQIPPEKEALPYVGTSSCIDTTCYPCFSGKCGLLLLR